jgi:hypothetical protein
MHPVGYYYSDGSQKGKGAGPSRTAPADWLT